MHKIYVFLAIFLTAVLFATLYINAEKNSYSRFLDAALLQNGVQINLISTSEYSRSDSGSNLNVGYNDSADPFSKEMIELSYRLLARLSGRAVTIAPRGTSVFESDKYVYVAPLGKPLDAGGDEFVRILRSSANAYYPSSKTTEFWKYIQNNIGRFNGTPMFFNAEFQRIDFDSLIRGNTKHSLANTTIEKAVVYVNTPAFPNEAPPESEKFTKYVLLQEIFQEYNLASDVNDKEFRLKSILYDHDEELGSMTGVERRTELQKNAAIGLCPFDVMLTNQLGTLGRTARKISILDFLKMKLKAYQLFWTEDSDLYDARCW